MGFTPVLEMNLGRYQHPPHLHRLSCTSIIPPYITPSALFIPALFFLYLVFQPAALSAIIIAKSRCFCVPRLNIRQSSISSSWFCTKKKKKGRKINTALARSLLALATANIRPCLAARTSQHWLSVFIHCPPPVVPAPQLGVLDGVGQRGPSSQEEHMH